MNFRILSRRTALIGLCLLPLAARAGEAVQVSDAWCRATPGAATATAIYLTIVNGAADAVTGATTPLGAASLHVHQMVNGVGQMRPVAQAELVPATPFRFTPMGYHIMLTGLTAPLKAGGHFPLTLHFAKAADVTVQVTVRPLREAAPMSAMPGMGAMPGMDMTK